MTDEQILEVAHRTAWRYKKSSDPHHSDTYTFNSTTMIHFANRLIFAERERCAAVAEEAAKEATRERRVGELEDANVRHGG